MCRKQSPWFFTQLAGGSKTVAKTNYIVGLTNTHFRSRRSRCVGTRERTDAGGPTGRIYSTWWPNGSPLEPLRSNAWRNENQAATISSWFELCDATITQLPNAPCIEDMPINWGGGAGGPMGRHKFQSHGVSGTV